MRIETQNGSKVVAPQVDDSISSVDPAFIKALASRAALRDRGLMLDDRGNVVYIADARKNNLDKLSLPF